ncbi:MAG TPA: sigma-70 family RNA polymerase sigma factor, partial [Chitinophagaceae bacterium]|nr:sigma-70 family RNA polymerase sigma factor [Chitinophagaceae bacterium]
NINNLIGGCKAGNRKAQEQLYRSYYRAMMNLCLRYTKNETDALEVLNTGFYKVFKNIGRFNPAKATLYTWIRSIIVNSCLDLIKVSQNKSETGELEQAANVHLAPAIIARMSASEILQLVRQLPPATQAVFNLYVIEGYNHIEIAKLISISEGTSKWHLSEARRKLQKMINEQNN